MVEVEWLPDGFAESDWRAIVDFVFRPVSRSLIFCGRMWILPWRDAASKMRIPGRYLADHPRLWWRIRGDARARVLLPRLFLSSLLSSFAHAPITRLSGSSRTRKAAIWMTKWNQSEIERARPCHSRSCVTSYSRKAGPEWWFPAMKSRWLSWLKPFWLSRGCNYTKRTEYSLFLSEWLGSVGDKLPLLQYYYAIIAVLYTMLSPNRIICYGSMVASD